MKTTLLFLITILAGLLLSCSDTKVAGTVSDTDTGKVGMVYNPDNTPAVNATIRFFLVGDTTREAASETRTDNNGRYATTGLNKGTYNILAKKDALVAYQDSVFISSDTSFVEPDTLGSAGTIAGFVGVQPNHDPRTVTVQVLGTDVYSNVDVDGRFALAPLAKGNYALRLVTTLPEYTTTYAKVAAAGGTNDTLADTLFLTYTGIPVVTGLSATYDTLNGIVTLHWKKTAYRNFQSYLIFRDSYTTITPSMSPIAGAIDSTYQDTIFSRSNTWGVKSFSDVNDYRYKYRISIQDNSNFPGNTYKFVDVTAASPTKVRTTYSMSVFHKAKGVFTENTTINDTLIYSVRAVNPTRGLKRLIWVNSAGTYLRVKNLDSTLTTATDTFTYFWSDLGRKEISCRVVDVKGNECSESVFVNVVADPPVVSLTSPLTTYAYGDTIRLHLETVDGFGTVKEIEWDIGNTGNFLENMTSDTFVLAPLPDMPVYHATVRVTDDDGSITIDTMTLNIRLFGSMLGSNLSSLTPNGISAQTNVVFNNKMWIIAGSGGPGVLSSQDGKIWTQTSSTVPFSGTQSWYARNLHSTVVYDNKMWVIGGTLQNWNLKLALINDVLYSSDGIEWTVATDYAPFSRRCGHTSIVYDNKMWVIGGSSADGALNDVWYSTDGVDWRQATDHAAFSPRWGHTSIVYDNKMWVIGGSNLQENAFYGSAYTPGFNDVWYSSDGVNWTLATAAAAFTTRSCHSSVVYDNKMWVIGGSQYVYGKWVPDGSQYMSDAWSSLDGSTWTMVSSSAGFPNRLGYTSCVYNNRLWVIGGLSNGNALKDIWRSEDLTK